MSKKNINTKKGFSLDWLIQGILTKFGETFDSFTGRKWTPSSSLATSELIERLKLLLDAEVQGLGVRGKFVPNNLKLKMQWDKFSTDSSEDALKKLENELLTAAVDHINDKRYHTYAPLKFEIKPDYFTEGIKLHAGFDNFSGENDESELNVTLPDVKLNDLPPLAAQNAENSVETFIAVFALNGTKQKTRLRFRNNQRLSVGRTRENDLIINDNSVSKVHASLVLNSEKALMVADTGSTNGTFVNGQRISYGTAALIEDKDTISFGTIDVSFEHVPIPVKTAEVQSLPAENSVTINGLEFKTKPDSGNNYNDEVLNSDILETETELKKKIKLNCKAVYFEQTDF